MIQYITKQDIAAELAKDKLVQRLKANPLPIPKAGDKFIFDSGGVWGGEYDGLFTVTDIDHKDERINTSKNGKKDWFSFYLWRQNIYIKPVIQPSLF